MKKVDNSDLYKKTPQQVRSDKKLEFERYWINWFDNINIVNPLESYILPQVLYDLKDVGINPKYNRVSRNKYMDELMGKLDCKMLFSGTNRRAYYCLYDPRVVLKVPISPTGIKNNLDEIYPQNILKPFCSKIHDVDPSGTIQLSERLIPITKLEERYLPEIYMLLTKKIQRDGILMDDIGVRSFKNYGIRSGFGVCLLDFPTVFISDRNLSRCNVCGGIISYDRFFNKIECNKCHMRYKPQDIAIKGNPMDIFKIHNMSKILKVNKTQDENFRRTSKMKVQFVSNGKVISSNRNVGYPNGIKPRKPMNVENDTITAKPEVDLQYIANGILNSLRSIDLNEFKESILKELPDEKNISRNLAEVLVKNANAKLNLDHEQTDIIVNSVTAGISKVMDRVKEETIQEQKEESSYTEEELKGEPFDPNDPENAVAIDMWTEMQKHAASKPKPVNDVKYEPSKEGVLDKYSNIKQEEEPVTNPDFFEKEDTPMEYTEGETVEEEFVSKTVEKEVEEKEIKRIPAFHKVKDEDVDIVKEQIEKEFKKDVEDPFETKLLDITAKINSLAGFEPFEKLDTTNKLVRSIDLDAIDKLYDDIMNSKVDDLVEKYLLDDEDYVSIWACNESLTVNKSIYDEAFQKKMYATVKDNKIKFSSLVSNSKFTFNLFGPYGSIVRATDNGIKLNKFNSLAILLIAFLPFRSNDINAGLPLPNYGKYIELFRNIETNNPNAYQVLKKIIFYYHLIKHVTDKTARKLTDDDKVISKSNLISDYEGNFYLFYSNDKSSKIYTDFNTTTFDLSIFNTAMKQIEMIMCSIGNYIFNCSDIDPQTCNMIALNLAEAINYSNSNLASTYIKNEVDITVDGETRRLFRYSYPLTKSNKIMNNILENTDVDSIRMCYKPMFRGVTENEHSESSEHNCKCGNCGCGHCE